MKVRSKVDALYPLVKYQLDDILKGLPVVIENYQEAQRTAAEHSHMNQIVENACEHEFQIAKED
jgi:hypothetical protein